MVQFFPMYAKVFGMSTSTVSDAWIGATVRGVAGLKGVRLDQIAERLAINPSTLSNKLSGERPWRAVEVAEAADILGVAVESLYNGYNGEVPPPDPSSHRPGRARRSRGAASRTGRFSTVNLRCRFVSLPVTTLDSNGGNTWMPHGHISTSCDYGAHHRPRSTRGGGCSPASKPSLDSRCSTRSPHSLKPGTAAWPSASSPARRPANFPGCGPSTAGR